MEAAVTALAGTLDYDVGENGDTLRRVGDITLPDFFISRGLHVKKNDKLYFSMDIIIRACICIAPYIRNINSVQRLLLQHSHSYVIQCEIKCIKV